MVTIHVLYATIVLYQKLQNVDSCFMCIVNISIKITPFKHQNIIGEFVWFACIYCIYAELDVNSQGNDL